MITTYFSSSMPSTFFTLANIYWLQGCSRFLSGLASIFFYPSLNVLVVWVDIGCLALCGSYIIRSEVAWLQQIFIRSALHFFLPLPKFTGCRVAADFYPVWPQFFFDPSLNVLVVWVDTGCLACSLERGLG